MQRHLVVFSVLGALGATLTACAPGASDTDIQGAEARSSDACQRESRYADGRCDSSCPLPDPDCAPHDTLQDLSGAGAPLCIAYRGNGPRIPAHFGATARILESYGLVSGSAGGSSGSISAFLLESVQMSEHVRCTGCSADEQALRAALMFKTIPALLAMLGERDDVIAARTLASIAGRVQSEEVAELLSSDGPRGVAALLRILESPDVRELVNPELLELLRTSPTPEFHARDLVATLSRGLSFEATDPTMFVRPGVLSFPALADRIGFVADFYAGVGPMDHPAFETFARECSAGSRGRTWEELRTRTVAGRTCEARFRSLVETYATARRGREGLFEHRVDQPIGAHLPTLVTTAVLEGQAVRVWQQARTDYLAGRPVRWGVSFDDVGIGYFGRPRELALAIGDPHRFRDDKTRRARALGQPTWRDVLSASPAEPGLSRGVELADGRISVGGWSDLQPTLVLRSMGCERIAFVTRRGGAGGFETGMARLLNASEADRRRLYALDDASSSYHRSLVESDAVSCSDWDAPSTTDFAAITTTGWNAPIETTDAAFTGARRAPTVTARTGLAGCTVGVADGAPRFSDVRGHAAESEIRALADRSVIAGFPDGTFQPDAPVTRAQLASILQRAFLADRAPGTARFSDVASTHWAARSIAIVADAGFMRGYPNGTFGPDRQVTREEVLVAIASGLGLTGGAASDLAVRFTDASSVSAWAAERVSHADRNGLLGNAALLGAARRLRPREAATRGEVASFVARALAPE